MAPKRKNNQQKNQKKSTKPPSSNGSDSKYHGLENQGATCYLNSVLQVLFMTKDFREAVSSSGNSGSECIDSRLSTLFNTLQNKTAKTQAITEHLKITRVSEQDDAAECFEKILSCSSPQALQVFQGLLTHRNTCFKCDRSTCNDQPFWSLPLPLVDSDKEYSVIKGIQHFFEESNISGENQMYCERCGLKTDASVKAEMKQHPQVLALLMKRFRFDYRDMKYVKITRTVEIPFILPIPHNEGQILHYELYACVQHSGDLEHGHYTVNIKPPDDKMWYNFNDTRVSPMTQMGCNNSSFRSQNAYLLFYRSSATHILGHNISEVPISEGSKNGNEDKGEVHEQDVKTGKRKVDEEVEATDSQKTDCRSKRIRNSNRNEDLKTAPDERNHTLMSQNSREAGENQQSKQNKDPESKKYICDKSICNPPACSPEQCKRDDLKLTEQAESRCSETEVHPDGRKSDEVCQDVSEISTSEAPKQNTQDQNKQHNQDVKTKERREDEEAEAADSQKNDKSNRKTKRNMPVRNNKDSKTPTDHNSCTPANNKSRKQPLQSQGQSSSTKVLNDVRLQEGNSQNSSPDASHRKQTSSQQQLKGEDSVTINTSENNQEHKQVISDSVLIRREHCDESEGSQDSGKLDEVCLNKLRDNQGQEVNTQVRKETKDLELKCDPGANNMDTLMGLNNCNQRDSSERSGNENINGKVENNVETMSLPALGAENAEKVLLGPQIEANNDKSHGSKRKGKKNKKGQNKHQKNVISFGLSSSSIKH